MYWAKCRKCSGKKFWKVRRGKLRCQSANVVCEETELSKYKVLKALNLVRQVMAGDIPEIFEGVVEVDETYLGGQKKNKRKSQLRKDKKAYGKDSERGFGTTKQPVFGILARNGKVYAELATRGYVHRTVEHQKKEYTRGKNHINGLEGFWGYLKRQLASRGGIRREKLPLYLAEYVWRYNNRKLSVEKQIEKLLNLVAKI